MSRVVIVGAGIAGVSTAEALREHGHCGEIVLLSDERVAPYDRPPLSKQVLEGAWQAEQTEIRPRSFYVDQQIDLRLRSKARNLDVQERTVELPEEVISYDHLVIATGLRPRSLAFSGRPGLHTLRTMDDCQRLRASVGPGAKVVIIGGGFVGLEVASTAIKRGAAVTVIEPQEVPLANALGVDIGTRVAKLHLANGVRILSGVGAQDVHGNEHVTSVQLSDRSLVPADCVVVAIGSTLNLDWLSSSGIDTATGVECDASCQVTGLINVYAVGDVAKRLDPRTGVRQRVEHWTNAVAHADIAARSIVGVEQGASYSTWPYFWSDQFGQKLQFLGSHSAEGSVTLEDRSSSSRERWITLFERSGIAVGAFAWNWPAAIGRLRRMLEAGDSDLDRVRENL